MIRHKKILKKGIFGILAVFIFVFSLTTVYSNQVAAAPGDPTTQPGGAQPANNQKKDDVTCAVKKIGWILCPIIGESSKIADDMFNVLANNFLQTDPALLSNDNLGTKMAWEIARNLANVMFIVVFIIIILSQVTGQGLSNYGIKRMLPRLIIASIAVNASYYICQLAADLTNILGFEIHNALEGVANQIGPSVFGQVQDLTNSQTSQPFGSSYGTILAVIGAAALAAGIVYLVLGPLIATVIGVMFICLTIIIILMLRKAMIVLLVVISPVAFVMYLLPNTERLFQKWYKMFMQLLMVFPVVGLLFGAGQLASTIILVAGATTNDPTATQVASSDPKSCDPEAPNNQLNPNNPVQNPNNNLGSSNIPCQGLIEVMNGRDGSGTRQVATSWQVGLVATGVAVAPLVAVFAVLRGALSAAGAIGGWVNSAGGKMRGGSMNLAGKLDNRRKEGNSARWQRFQARSMEQGGLSGKLAGRRALRQRKLAMSKDDLERQQQQYASDKIGAGKGVGGLSDEGQERAKRAAEAALESKRQEEMKAEKMEADRLEVYSGQDANGNQIKGLGDALPADIKRGLESGNIDLDSPKMAAQIQRVMEAGSSKMRAALIDAISHSGKDSLANRTVTDYMSSHNPGFWKPQDMDAIRRGSVADGVTATSMAQEAIAGGRLGAEKMADLGGDDMGWVQEIAKNHQGAQAALSASVKDLYASPQLVGKLRHNKSGVEAIRDGRW